MSTENKEYNTFRGIEEEFSILYGERTKRSNSTITAFPGQEVLQHNPDRMVLSVLSIKSCDYGHQLSPTSPFNFCSS